MTNRQHFKPQVEDHAFERQNQRGEPPRHVQGVKVSHTFYSGSSDPQEYLDWEAKCDQIFDYCRYDDEQKFELSTIHLADFALAFWRQDTKEHRLNDKYPIRKCTVSRRHLSIGFYPPTTFNKCSSSLRSYAKESVPPRNTTRSHVASCKGPLRGTRSSTLL